MQDLNPKDLLKKFKNEKQSELADAPLSIS
jgi:hypothetical protein